MNHGEFSFGGKRLAAPPIQIQTSDLEVEKPSGGGKGKQTLYVVEVLLDGEVALHLTRDNFKKAGQMEAFASLMRERCQ